MENYTSQTAPANIEGTAAEVIWYHRRAQDALSRRDSKSFHKWAVAYHEAQSRQPTPYKWKP